MPRGKPFSRYLIAAAILATLLLTLAAPAMSATRTYSAVKVRGDLATFRVAGLKQAAVRSGRVTLGRSVAHVKLATVRRAARRGTLGVRLSRLRWTGSRRRTHSRRRHNTPVRRRGHPDRHGDRDDKRGDPDEHAGRKHGSAWRALARTKHPKLVVTTTEPPSVSITAAPPSPTDSTDASIAFSTSGATTTQCQLDLGAWTACASPVAYADLGSGDHSFTARVTNSAGSASASASWTVLASTSTNPAAPPAGEPVPASGVAVGPLIFSDEFHGSSLDLSKWRPNWLAGSDTAITKPVNSAEKSCYDPAQVAVSEGSLRLTAVQRACTASNGVTYPYASGLVQSNSDFRFSYGYSEAKMFLPPNTDPGLGAVGSCGPNWPAFWTNGQSWPDHGEIDVMECLGDDVTSSYHWSGGEARLTPSAWKKRMPAGDAGWHTFGVDWKPGSLRFYYDGLPVGTQTTGVAASQHYLIAQLAISGTAIKVPQTLAIDYVRVWGRP